MSKAVNARIKLGIDCHTMAAIGATLADDKGIERPLVSIADSNGLTLPLVWRERFVECLEKAFELPVAVNHPFSGGHISSTHSTELDEEGGK